MIMKLPFICAIVLFILPSLAKESLLIAQSSTNIRGVVFHDKNENGIYDAGDKPLRDVAVSNGRDVVVTNKKGEYVLPLRDDAATFIIKPRNWSVPVDDNQIPR